VLRTDREAHPSLRFPDGTEVTAQRAGSELRLARSSPTEVIVDLLQGVGRFHVTRDPQRRFEVRCAGATVRVLGTDFDVERLDQRLAVRVMSGAVAVTCGDAVIHLGADQQQVIDCAAPTPRASADALLSIADRARTEGRPGDAVAPLEDFLRWYPTDVRAAATAYTLGGVLLDELHRPGDARRAFALTRSVAPTGPLVAGALARERECLTAMGNRSDAGP
jgi:hypothetical protein